MYKHLIFIGLMSLLTSCSSCSDKNNEIQDHQTEELENEIATTDGYTTQDIQNNALPAEISFKKEGEVSLKNGDQLLKTFDVEIAETEDERNIGLMNRSSMPENQGMLFVFQKPSNSGFYMRNTRIPLDIIYIGSDKKVVSIAKNAIPQDSSPLPSKAPYSYVLEINGGLSDALGVKENETVLEIK